MRFSSGFAAAVTLVLALGVAPPARADKNDLVLSRLGLNVEQNPGEFVVVPDNARFRSLVSQLGVALAPRFLTPADTLGFSGFNFSADLSFTAIDADGDYWCATEEAAGCAGGGEKGSSTLGTVGIFVRKGIWLPLP